MMVSYGNTFTDRQHNRIFSLHEKSTFRTIKMSMKFFILKKKAQKTIADYKLELVLQKGREQLKKLTQLGIAFPVVTH